MTNNVLNKWSEIKTLVEAIEDDVQKNATGNKTTAPELVKLTLGKE
jgi:hypothetical protein